MELEKFFSECMIIAMKTLVRGILWSAIVVIYVVGISMLAGMIDD